MTSPTNKSSVSVVVATYNAADDLADAGQRWSELVSHAELVVQDGSSSDGTLEILEVLRAAGIVASLLSSPDNGVYQAWNSALDRCHGDWVLFYGAADTIPLDWIKALTSVDPDEADVVVGDLSIVGIGGRTFTIESDWSPKSKSELFNHTLLPHVGMAHSKHLFAGRRFDENFRIAGDRDLLMDAWPFRVRRIEAVCQGMMVLGGLSNSPRMLRVANQEDRSMQLKHGVTMTWPRYLRGLAKNVLSKAPWLWRMSQIVALRMRSTIRD